MNRTARPTVARGAARPARPARPSGRRSAISRAGYRARRPAAALLFGLLLGLPLGPLASCGAGTPEPAAQGRGAALPAELASDYERARERVRAGDDAAAEDLLERVVAAAPEHAEAAFLLGFVHHRRSIVQLGAASVDHARLERAESLFRRAFELEPSAEVALHVGLALERRKALDEASLWFRRAIELDGADPRPWMRLGVADLHLGRLEEAREHLEGALEREPEDPDAWHQLGLVHSELGDWERAAEHLERSVELAPDAARWFDLSTALRRAGRDGDADAALAAFDRLEANAPRAAAGGDGFERGGEAARAGRFDEALDAFLEALEADPEHFGARLGAGGAALKLGRAPEAVRHLEKAARLRPDDAFAHGQLGRARSRLSDWTGAAAAFARAVELAPDDPRHRADLGSVLLAAGDLEGARPHLDRAVELAPADLRARMNRGVLHERAGEREAAERDYGAVVAADPEFPGARAALERTRAR